MSADTHMGVTSFCGSQLSNIALLSLLRWGYIQTYLREILLIVKGSRRPTCTFNLAGRKLCRKKVASGNITSLQQIARGEREIKFVAEAECAHYGFCVALSRGKGKRLRKWGRKIKSANCCWILQQISPTLAGHWRSWKYFQTRQNIFSFNWIEWNFQGLW